MYAGTGDDIRTREDLESTYIGMYGEAPTLAFQSATEQRFVKSREGPLAVDALNQCEDGHYGFY